MTLTVSELKAYESGVAACLRAESLLDNPHLDKNLAAIWEDGYDDCLATGRIGIAPGTGKPVFVRHGTPLSCDPTSETYWCM